MASNNLGGLPRDVRQRLDEWRESIDATLGDKLTAILVYGSAVRGEFKRGVSNINAVVVVTEASLGDLEAVSNAMRLARYSARIEAMVLTDEELQGASDVFPLLFDEIKGQAVTIHGKDPFVGVDIHDTHRRLRIEQELREAQLRLRKVALESLEDPTSLAEPVLRVAKRARGALRALLQLKGGKGREDLATVLAQAGRAYSVDVTLVSQAREKPRDAYRALDLLLSRAVADVNAMAH